MSDVKIKAVLITWESKPDRDNNRYFAFRCVLTENGRTIEGLVDEINHVLAAANSLFQPSGYFWQPLTGWTKRQLMNKCGAWHYAGHSTAEIANFIKGGY